MKINSVTLLIRGFYFQLGPCSNIFFWECFSSPKLKGARQRKYFRHRNRRRLSSFPFKVRWLCILIDWEVARETAIFHPRLTSDTERLLDSSQRPLTVNFDCSALMNKLFSKAVAEVYGAHLWEKRQQRNLLLEDN